MCESDLSPTPESNSDFFIFILCLINKTVTPALTKILTSAMEVLKIKL